VFAYLSSLIFGYLLGSIPFGLLLTKFGGAGDIRSIGSGNIGATNVLRTGNKGLAAATLLGDMLKGTIAVIVAGYFGGPNAAIAAGVGAFVGHLFPVWLKFKGGKGVATGIGVLFGWAWILGLVFIVAWIATFFITRISSASALTAALLAVPASFVLAKTMGGNTLMAVWPVALLALIVWLTHHANIRRLLKGEEPKSSFKKA